MKESLDEAVKFICKMVRDLLNGKFDISDLVVSKTLSKSEYKTLLPQSEVARKMAERDSSTAPHIGERVYYVIVAGPKSTPLYQLAEDPLYVLEHDIPLNIEHYLDALKKAVGRVLEEIDPKLVNFVFKGEHTLSKKINTVNRGPLAGFVTKNYRCLNCKQSIDAGLFCDSCNVNDCKKILEQRSLEFAKLQKLYSIIWSRCQECQGTYLNELPCSNKDCSVFYQRINVKRACEKMYSEFIEQIKTKDELQW